MMRFPVSTLGSGFSSAGAFLLRQFLIVVKTVQRCDAEENDDMGWKEGEVAARTHGTLEDRLEVNFAQSSHHMHEHRTAL